MSASGKAEKRLMECVLVIVEKKQAVTTNGAIRALFVVSELLEVSCLKKELNHKMVSSKDNSEREANKAQHLMEAGQQGAESPVWMSCFSLWIHESKKN